jgi:hypothetical protein
MHDRSSWDELIAELADTQSDGALLSSVPVRPPPATDPPSSADTVAATTKRKQTRPSTRYSAIDRALRDIAASNPKKHEDVFQLLEYRIVHANAEPFRSAGGWVKGFKKNPAAAHAWLFKRWSLLELPPFPRGPK